MHPLSSPPPSLRPAGRQAHSPAPPPEAPSPAPAGCVPAMPHSSAAQKLKEWCMEVATWADLTRLIPPGSGERGCHSVAKLRARLQGGGTGSPPSAAAWPCWLPLARPCPAPALPAAQTAPPSRPRCPGAACSPQSPVRDSDRAHWCERVRACFGTPACMCGPAPAHLWHAPPWLKQAAQLLFQRQHLCRQLAGDLSHASRGPVKLSLRLRGWGCGGVARGCCCCWGGGSAAAAPPVGQRADVGGCCGGGAQGQPAEAGGRTAPPCACCESRGGAAVSSWRRACVCVRALRSGMSWHGGALALRAGAGGGARHVPAALPWTNKPLGGPRTTMGGIVKATCIFWAPWLRSSSRRASPCPPWMAEGGLGARSSRRPRTSRR